MSKRYYYTDPLAAAWMALHFGVVLEDEGQYGAVRNHKNAESILTDMEDCHSVELDRAQQMYYLNSNSLHILEPMVGDLVSNTHDAYSAKHRPCSGIVVGFMNDNTSAVVSTGIRHNGKEAFVEAVRALKIIQRNGVAFMWPEQEKE